MQLHFLSPSEIFSFDLSQIGGLSGCNNSQKYNK